MKRLSLLVISFCVGFVFFFPGRNFAQKANPYVIGLGTDLTGFGSNIGIGHKRGTEITIDEINSGGGVNGRSFKVVFSDNESNTAKAVLNIKRLIEVDKVIACMGYGSSGTALASIQTAEAGKTVLFANAVSEKIWIPTKKWVFCVVPRQLDGSTPFLVENLLQRGSKKIAYVYMDSVFGQSGKEVFDKVCMEKKITPVIVEKYAPGTTNVDPLITHIKAAGADGMLLCGYLADSVMVIKTARDAGFNYPIVCEQAIIGPEFTELAGKYGEGILAFAAKTLVAHELPDNDIQKKVCVSFYDKYTKLYGPYLIYAGHFWDTLHLIREALKTVDPKLDPANESDLVKIREKLRDNLEKIKGFVGQNGVFNFSADNHNGLTPRCYVPVVVEKGKWVSYKEKR